MTARQKRLVVRPVARTSHVTPRGVAFYMTPADAVVTGGMLIVKGFVALVKGAFLVVDLDTE